MSDCSSCASNQNGGCASGGSCPSGEAGPTEAQKRSHIKNIIVVMSGKGGVGKSSFSSLVAIALNKKGYQVGLLDADITGPSIPKLFGVKAKPEVTEFGALPVESKTKIKLMSMNFMLPHEDDPVIWRGPVIASVIKQFTNEVVWGDLDYLVIDLPPGTGDVPLTILQGLEVTGAIIVTTPQSLSNMVVRKGIKMLELMEVPVLGLAENMSYLPCPDCDSQIEIFGKSHLEETSKAFDLNLLGRFPLDPTLAQLGDEGNIEAYQGKVLELLMENIEKILPQA